MVKSARFLACGAALLLSWVSAGCGGTSKYDLVIVSPHDENITSEFEQAFSRVFKERHGRDVRISWRDVGGGTETQMKFIHDRFSRHPSGIGIDVFFGGGIDPYLTLKADGLLQPYRVGNVEVIPKDLLGLPLRDAGYCWYGAALSSFGILYNKTVLRKLGVSEPTTWEDMTDPRLFGYVGLADPSQSGSARAIYEIILQAYGWERGMHLVTLMAANARDFYTGSSSLALDLTLGDIAMGPVIDFYGWTQIARGGEETLGFILPEKLTVLTPDAIGILKGAPNVDTAQEFLDFVMGEQGQKLWMLKAGSAGGPVKHNLMRMSVLPGLYREYPPAARTVKLNPFEFKGSFPHDSDKASLRREFVADLMKSLFIQPQGDLRACWKAVLNSPGKEELVRKMTALPVSEQDGLEAARLRWHDAVYRANRMTDWVRLAVKKYQDVKAEAEGS
jgi:ABC-type Fe3+ transport system substrate-binding protein